MLIIMERFTASSVTDGKLKAEALINLQIEAVNDAPLVQILSSNRGRRSKSFELNAMM